MAAIAGMKQEWQHFKDDEPGHRFENYRRRMKTKSKWVIAAHAMVGVALIGAGIVFLFLPGPGLLGVVFGLALFAGMSRKLAGLMDRAEPRIRVGVHRAQNWWHHLSRPRQAVLIAMAAVVVAVGSYVVWKRWIGPKFFG